MGIWDRLKQAFGGSGAERDEGYYFYVRCNRCADLVRVRLNLGSELQQDFGDSGDDLGGYSVRKVVVDQKCFRPIETRLRFDRSRREVSREIAGGAFLTREEFEAAKGSA